MTKNQEDRLRLELENIVLLLDRAEPNVALALQIAAEQLALLGGRLRK